MFLLVFSRKPVNKNKMAQAVSRKSTKKCPKGSHGRKAHMSKGKMVKAVCVKGKKGSKKMSKGKKGGRKMRGMMDRMKNSFNKRFRPSKYNADQAATQTSDSVVA